MTASDASLAGNPLLTQWATPFGLPPFESVAPEHYKPAFDAALAEQQKQIAAIAEDADEPSFTNTIEALEKSGQALKKVGGVFFNLAGSHTNDAIQEVERELAPQEAKHWNRILMDEAMFSRIDALHRRRDELGLRLNRASLQLTRATLITANTRYRQRSPRLPRRPHYASNNNRSTIVCAACGLARRCTLACMIASRCGSARSWSIL